MVTRPNPLIKELLMDKITRKTSFGQWFSPINLGATFVEALIFWLMKNKLKYGAHYTKSGHVCVKVDGSIITPSVIKYNTRKMSRRIFSNKPCVTSNNFPSYILEGWKITNLHFSPKPQPHTYNAQSSSIFKTAIKASCLLDVTNCIV